MKETNMTNETNTPAVIVPPLPEPLSLYKLHSPEVRRAHQAAVEAHYSAKRAAERQAAQKEEAQRAHANRYLTAQEYWEASVARENENRAKQAEREAARYAEEQQKKEALAASPDIADILTNNPAELLRQVCHWNSRGYVLNEEGPLAFLPPSLFHCQMKKAPAKKARAADKEAV
jgi:hypothetical protein